MGKLIAVGLWVVSVLAAGIEVKYPGLIPKDVLGVVSGLGATGLLFTAPVHK